jgi:hypothetical protein
MDARLFGISPVRGVSCGAAMIAVLCGTPALAVVSAFSDRPTWLAAIGSPTFSEDFSSFAVDTPFHSTAVALSQMTIAREGPEAGLTNFVDVVPLSFPSGSGTNQAELFTNFAEGVGIGTQVRIDFDQPNVAFGLDAWVASDFEGALMQVYDGAILLDSLVVPGGNGAFLGYTITGGTATSVLFQSATLIVGTTGEGFVIDNLAGVAVPEPAGVALALLAAPIAAIHVRGRWRRGRSCAGRSLAA